MTVTLPNPGGPLYLAVGENDLRSHRHPEKDPN